MTVEAASWRARAFVNSQREEARTYEGIAPPRPKIAEDNPAAGQKCSLQTFAPPTAHVHSATSTHGPPRSKTPPRCTATVLRCALPVCNMGRSPLRARASTRARAFETSQRRAVTITGPKRGFGTLICRRLISKLRIRGNVGQIARALPGLQELYFFFSLQALGAKDLH